MIDPTSKVDLITQFHAIFCAGTELIFELSKISDFSAKPSFALKQNYIENTGLVFPRDAMGGKGFVN